MLKIDGHEAAARGTLLEMCRTLGIHLPAFCADDHRLSRGGHCRACLVEVNGRPVAACTTLAADAMIVATDTQELREYRRDLGELMRAECSPAGPVADELSQWGVRGDRYVPRWREPRRDATHPYLRIDLERCILCRRCVRACEEIEGRFVFAVKGRGAESEITWGDRTFASTDCVACGACAATCPTGAISDVDRERQASERGVVRTTCAYCGVGCQLDVHVSDHDVVRIDGADQSVNRGHLCVKGRYAHGFERHPDRLTQPLVRRAGRLVPVSWEAALEVVAKQFLKHRGRAAGVSSSRCTNEENYLFQKWFRTVLHTNDVDCCARVCHAPSAMGMRTAFGTGAATNSYADVERADLLMVVGANATDAHPVLGARIKQAVLRGAKLIVIDPRRTELAAMADVHLQLAPGTNVPLLNALASVILNDGLVAREFIAQRVDGFDQLAAFLALTTPEATASVTGVPAARVRAAAHAYAKAARPMMVHGLGVTEHYQGSEAVMLLCNLALLVGAIGREGVGVNPLRGQNNVQGAADMGCQPDFLPGYASVTDAAARARFAAEWGGPVPSQPGRTIPQMFEAARRGELKALYVFGEDLLQTDPDSGRTREALSALDFLVVQEIFLSQTAELAHVVLPGATFLEKDGTFTNAERRIQRVRPALAPPGEAREDWRILNGIMAASGHPQHHGSASEVMVEIARVVPAFAGVSYDRLEGDGLQWPVLNVTDPGTALLHRGGFARGRARLTRVEYVPSPGLRPGLTLITGRVLEHYNSGSMTRRTPNVTLCSTDWLEMHPQDAAARSITDGARVAIRSEHGAALATARVTDRVAPGVVFLSFHFPQTHTNAVTGQVRDRLADCPEYKVTSVEVGLAY